MAAPKERRRVELATDLGAVQVTRVDYVAPGDIDAYRRHAASIGWQVTAVGTENDHGPGGPDGDYTPPPSNEKD